MQVKRSGPEVPTYAACPSGSIRTQLTTVTGCLSESDDCRKVALNVRCSPAPCTRQTSLSSFALAWVAFKIHGMRLCEHVSVGPPTTATPHRAEWGSASSPGSGRSPHAERGSGPRGSRGALALPGGRQAHVLQKSAWLAGQKQLWRNGLGEGRKEHVRSERKAS